MRNKRTLHELKSTYDGKYWRVNLCSSNKDSENKFKRQFKSLHRLIANVFIKKKKKYVDHIDGSTNNHNIENLRWCTASENKQYSHDKKGSKVILQLDLTGNLLGKMEFRS